MSDALTLLPSWLAEGQQALEQGRFVDAARAFERAADGLPAEFSLHQMAASAWRLAGEVVRERERWRLAFERARPDDAERLYSLGAGLLETGAPTEARACFGPVVSRRPRDPAALSALASAYRAEGDPASAWPLVERALKLANDLPSLLLTASQVRYALGDTVGALHWLAKAERIRPGHPLQGVQRAFSHLSEGPCTAGWAAFEARGLPTLPPETRDWHGEALAGQSIAVVMEQGLGDLFHFVRYVRRLEARGASRVVVECPPSAVRLLMASGFDAVPTGQLPKTDWAVPLLSLPHRLGSDGDTASELVPYLHTGAAPAVRSSGPPRVGIVYKGNPAFLSTVLRDLDTAALEAVLAIPNVRWTWLQYGDRAPNLTRNDLTIETPSLTDDWFDTAVLLSSLDAIVSVDTAIAHLAGAMGQRVMVLLPHVPDWRWGRGTPATAWYPSATLIRQPISRDWDGAVTQLRELITATGP